MKVLITGAGGSVGGRLADRFSIEDSVIALGHRDLDICDEERVFEMFASERPDIIFNCAVMGVDECERDVEGAYAVNAAGPRNLAKAASYTGAAVVHFSTNYVFDGALEDGYYTIDDEPRPINVYGRTKWKGEQAVAAACDQSYIIRTSWVYGGAKGFFDKAIASLLRGSTVQAVADNWASTTLLSDLVGRVFEIIDHGRFGTYQVVNRGVCSKYEFAVEAARNICGSDELVEAIVAKDLVVRPRYTPMWCKMSDEIGLPPMRDWRLALRGSTTRRQ